MENEVYITGDYISGIVKRPDLVNNNCVLVYKDNGFSLFMAPNDKAEEFVIPYDTVENITFRPRVVVSEKKSEIKNTEFNRDLLAFALAGPAGVILNRTASFTKAFDIDRGNLDYNDIYELMIEYSTSEGNRRLLINVNSDPSEFINHFDDIK
ncbi:MAG: hypothetical protein IJI58_01385 [Bacilli bacterium]|nr:hypothetical protein [Bacilli bacterium]